MYSCTSSYKGDVCEIAVSPTTPITANVGIIAGCVVGGFFLLLIIFGLIFYFVIRPRLLGNKKYSIQLQMEKALKDTFGGT